MQDCLVWKFYACDTVTAYNWVLGCMQAVFAEVYELDIDEDVNRVLFALPAPAQHRPMQEQQQQQSQQGKGKKQKKQPSKAAQPTIARIDGSAAAVKLLRLRLAQVLQADVPQGVSDIDAMLENLSLLSV